MKKSTTLRSALWLMLATLMAMTPMAGFAVEASPAKTEAKVTTTTTKSADKTTSGTKKTRKRRRGKKVAKATTAKPAETAPAK